MRRHVQAHFGAVLAAGLVCFLLRAPAARAGADEAPTTAYENDFKGKVGPEWSNRKTDATPANGRQFLGQFGNDEVSLSLAALPAHKYVRVSVDLFVIRSWDGTNDHLREVGPDVWSLKVAGGPLLVRTTFSNTTVMRCDTQNFPNMYPGPSVPRRTGAAETDTLGYQFPLSGGDAVYKIVAIFPHQEANLALAFAATNLEPLDNESWGLGGVKVEVFSAAKPMGAGRLQECWRELEGNDPVKAMGSMWEMVWGGDDTVEFLSSHLKPAEANVSEARRLVGLLTADDWKTREDATRQLRDMGAAILPLLRQALESKPEPETDLRLRSIVEELQRTGNSAPALALQLRAVHLLDVIGTAKARRLLAEYSGMGTGGAASRPAAGADGNKVASGVEAILAQARLRASEWDFDEAALACARAMALAKSARSPAEVDALAMLARVMGMAAAYREYDSVATRYKNGERDGTIRADLASYCLADLDSPKRAAAYVGADLHPEWVELLELAGTAPVKLNASQCLKLGAWYLELSPRFRALGMVHALERSKMYYEAYLRLEGKPEPAAAENLKEIQARLEKRGHFPPKPLLKAVGT